MRERIEMETSSIIPIDFSDPLYGKRNVRLPLLIRLYSPPRTPEVIAIPATYDLSSSSVKAGGAGMGVVASYELADIVPVAYGLADSVLAEVKRGSYPDKAILKIPRPGKPEFVSREARVLETLTGKSFVPTLLVHDESEEIGFEGSTVYVLVEHAEGIPLVDTYGEWGIKLAGALATLSPRQRVRLVVDLAEMARETHANGITLSDWKYEDIFVRKDGAFKAVDWGSAGIKGEPPVNRSHEANSPDFKDPMYWQRVKEADVRGLARITGGILQQEEIYPPFELDVMREGIERSCRGAWELVEPLFHVREDNVDGPLEDAISRLHRGLTRF